MQTPHPYPPPALVLRMTVVLMLIAFQLLGGCASIPDRPLPDHAAPRLHWAGARGALSARQIAAVYQHLQLEAPDADALRRHLAIEQAISASPLYSGNAVQVLRDGGETFPAMFAALRGARRTILLEYYIFDNISSGGQSLLELLRAKRAEGVNIAVLYDNIGSAGTDDAFLAALRDAGVQLLEFNPVNPFKARHHWSLNDRDHRKLLVVDHSVAIMGGVNLSRDYESTPSASPAKAAAAADAADAAHAANAANGTNDAAAANWRDTDIRITGPAVPALERLFYRHWHSQGGPPLPGEDDAADVETAGDQVVHIIASTPEAPKPRYYATVLSAIKTAEHSVWITAAYFVPTHQEKRLLKAAARRGIDVRLLLPSKTDSGAALAVQHSSYGDLLEAGVKIYEREGVILHSKCVVVDTVWSVIGSSNFDHRSVLFNDEVDAVVIGQETAQALTALFESDLREARPVDLAAWRRRPLGERSREFFWRIWTKLI